MDGASPSARERTLKTLERLTARLALAESERDMALGMSNFKSNQKRAQNLELEIIVQSF